MSTVYLPLTDLVISPLNMRKGKADKNDDKQLKASIATYGILQNLVVHRLESGQYGVAAGGRRLQVLQELTDENGTDPDEVSVPCLEVSDADAAAATLAENVRAEPHPVDEFLAYKQLRDANGATIKAIASQFGVSNTYVKQRLALGDLHPDVLEDYRKGELEMDEVQDFTATQDQEKQRDILKLLRAGNINPWEIRKHLNDGGVDAADRRMKIVGMKAYKAAGGRIATDLFGDRKTVLDVELLDELARESAGKVVQRLKDEGWANVEYVKERPDNFWSLDRVSYTYGPEEQAQIDQLQAELDAMAIQEEEVSDDKYAEWETQYDELADRIDELKDSLGLYSEEDKARAQVWVYPDWNDQLEILRVLPKSKADGAETTTSTAAWHYSRPVDTDLAAERQRILQKHTFKDSRMNEILTLYLHWCMVDQRLCRNLGGTLSVWDSDVYPSDEDFERLGLTEDDHGTLRVLDQGSEGQRFRTWLELDEAPKHRLLSAAIALSLKTPELKSDDRAETAADVLAELTSVPWEEYYTPTIDGFFNRLKKPQLMAILEDIYGGKPFDLPELEKMKKGALASYVEGAAKTATWLPKGF